MVFSTSVARSAGIALVSIALTGCYDPDPMPVSDIGRADRSLAVPLAPVSSGTRQANYPVLEGTVQQVERQQQSSAVQAVDIEARGAPPTTLAEQAAKLEGESPQVSQASAPPQSAESEAGADEVDMDKAFGFTGSQQSSAAAPQIAEGDVDAPVVDGVGTGQLRDLSAKRQIPIDAAVTTRKPLQQQQVAYIPKFQDPMSVPESHGGMPASEKSCRQELSRLSVAYEDIAPIDDGPQCGIENPVEIKAINGIRVMPAAKLNCGMALTFARWVRNDLTPSTRMRYFSGVRAIRQLSSYSCRHMNSKSNNPWSEHARGNAIDIGSIILNNGDEIDVRKPGFFSFRQKGLLNSVRADSCKYFNTVLGPGDPYHGDHFHFDLRSRKSGRRYCSLD